MTTRAREGFHAKARDIPGRPRLRPRRVLADKAYSSRADRAHLRRHGVQAVIPTEKDQRANRLKQGRRGGRPPGFDRERHKERNTAERCINKLKGNRAVALRTDKRERIYRGTVDVASIRIWLRDPVHRSAAPAVPGKRRVATSAARSGASRSSAASSPG
ncbi:transposase [Streptosporangium sp. LJ11]|uniref:transposase n=1 Tax=Streptosporangium sp. LJ11 TaxID=3436927 RepID=UPI003F79E6C1